MCGREGALRTFVSADAFKLLSGEEALTDYQFNKHLIHHVFCNVCGIRSFARGTNRDGKPMVSVNIRCLEGLDPDTVAVTKFDGRNH